MEDLGTPDVLGPARPGPASTSSTSRWATSPVSIGWKVAPKGRPLIGLLNRRGGRVWNWVDRWMVNGTSPASRTCSAAHLAR